MQYAGLELMHLARIKNMEIMMSESSYSPVKISEPPNIRGASGNNQHHLSIPLQTECQSSFPANTKSALRTWIPTWWEYIGNCRQFLRASELLLVVHAASAASSANEEPESSIEKWSVLLEPGDCILSNDHDENIYTRPFSPAARVTRWANEVCKAGGEYRAFPTRIPGTHDLSVFQHFYHLKIAPPNALFPKTFACLTRAGGSHLDEEELDFFKASMDLVGSQLLLALKCNAFRHRASRFQLALSIPATMLEGTCTHTPCQRMELLNRTCQVVGCHSAKLAIFNANWDEMQVVVGWPSLTSEDMISFLSPHVGAVVEP